MSIGLFYSFAMVMGFALAGVAGSFYRLLTRRRISFEMTEAGRFELLFGMIVLMFAGPAVIMRNALRGRFIERRTLSWLALSTLIAAMWSVLAGMTLIHGLNVLDG